MKTRMLVTYATTYGSTREIAEAVADALREKNIEVDLQPAGKVNTLAAYQAVILGTALYMGRVHKDARKFLSKHSQAFSDTMPLAVFASGPLQPEDDWNEIRKMLARDLSVYPWLKPAAVEVFGGKYDPAKLQFPYTLLPAMKNMPASDLRDWESIRIWTDKVADIFQTMMPK